MRSYLATLQREILLVGCVSREHTVHHDVVLAGSYQSMAFDKHRVTRGICLFRQETLLASEKARTTRYQSAYECGMFVVGLGRKHERLLSGFGHDLDFSTIGGYSRCVATEYLGLVNDLKLATLRACDAQGCFEIVDHGACSKEKWLWQAKTFQEGAQRLAARHFLLPYAAQGRRTAAAARAAAALRGHDVRKCGVARRRHPPARERGWVGGSNGTSRNF